MDGFSYGSYNINIQLPLNRENDDMMVDVREHIIDLRKCVKDFYDRKNQNCGGRELFTAAPKFEVKWEYVDRTSRGNSSPLNGPGVEVTVIRTYVLAECNPIFLS